MQSNQKLQVFNSVQDFKFHCDKDQKVMVVYKNIVYDLSQFMYRHSGG